MATDVGVSAPVGPSCSNETAVVNSLSPTELNQSYLSATPVQHQLQVLPPLDQLACGPTAINGVPLPQTPEDPTILQNHLANQHGQQSNASLVLQQSVSSSNGRQICQNGDSLAGTASEIQSQETSSTETGDSKGSKKNNHGKLIEQCRHSTKQRII